MSIVPYNDRYHRGLTTYQPYRAYNGVRGIYSLGRLATPGGITYNNLRQVVRGARDTYDFVRPYYDRWRASTGNSVGQYNTGPRQGAIRYGTNNWRANNPRVEPINIPPTPPPSMGDSGVAVARAVARKEFGTNGKIPEIPESTTITLRRNFAINNPVAAINDVGRIDMLWPLTPTIDLQTGGAIPVDNQHPGADKAIRAYRNYRVDAWRIHIGISRIATTNNESHFVLALPVAGILSSFTAIPLWSATLAQFAGQTYASRYERCKADHQFKIGPIVSFGRQPDLAMYGTRNSHGWRSDWITPGQLTDVSSLEADVQTTRDGLIVVAPSTNTLTITAPTFGASLGLMLLNFGDNLAGMAVDTFRLEITHEAQFTFYAPNARVHTSFTDV